MTSFKESYPLKKRINESTRIKKKYPDRIPVIVERHMSTNIAHIDKKKYLVPDDLTIGQFTYVIRKRIKLEPIEALFLFVNDTLPATSAMLSQIYKNHKDQDGFLYIQYCGESTFGAIRV